MEKITSRINEATSGKEKVIGLEIEGKTWRDWAVEIENQRRRKRKEESWVARVHQKGKGKNIETSIKCKRRETKIERTSLSQRTLPKTLRTIQIKRRKRALITKKETSISKTIKTTSQPLINPRSWTKSYRYPQRQRNDEKQINQNEQLQSQSL